VTATVTVTVSYLDAQRECIAEQVQLGVQHDGDLAHYDAQRATLEATKKEQLEWLNNTLATSKAHWLIVAGHFPVYSGGEHGNTPEMLTDIKPLLEHYNVDAYLCGHVCHCIATPFLPSLLADIIFSSVKWFCYAMIHFM
jgi:hypothetical protein